MTDLKSVYRYNSATLLIAIDAWGSTRMGDDRRITVGDRFAIWLVYGRHRYLKKLFSDLIAIRVKNLRSYMSKVPFLMERCT